MQGINPEILKEICEVKMPFGKHAGIILGLKIFGFLGLIFGPILVSITVLLMQIYGDEFSEEIEDSPNDIVLPESEKPLQSKIDIDI